MQSVASLIADPGVLSSNPAGRAHASLEIDTMDHHRVFMKTPLVRNGLQHVHVSFVAVVHASS